jgi:hypothetical protein
MKRLLLIIAVPFVLGGIAFAVPAEKVTICHATSSATNPYTRIVVSANATGAHFEEHGTQKAGHEDDILLQGEQDCPISNPPVVTGSTTTVTPTASGVPEEVPTQVGK